MSPRVDTLAIARDLRKHFTQDQAEALAGAVNQAADLPDLSQLATKDDLKNAVIDLRADLRAGLADVKSDILKWVTGLIVTSVSINVAAIVALVKMLGH